MIFSFCRLEFFRESRVYLMSWKRVYLKSWECALHSNAMMEQRKLDALPRRRSLMLGWSGREVACT